ncbi:unnamed protein product [Caretta caretta]
MLKPEVAAGFAFQGDAGGSVRMVALVIQGRSKVPEEDQENKDLRGLWDSRALLVPKETKEITENKDIGVIQEPQERLEKMGQRAMKDLQEYQAVMAFQEWMALWEYQD